MYSLVRQLFVISATAVAASTLAGGAGVAQEPGARRGDPQLVSPEVAADRRVTFRLRAPEAKAVTVSGDFGNDVEMRRAADGVWSATIGPLDPEMYVYYFTADGVTHVEEGASDPPMKGVLIELKTPAPRPATAESPDGLRQVAGAPAWENNRAAAWVLMSGVSSPAHRHAGDAVELIFEASTTPKAAFVPAGTVHAAPTPPTGGRAYIFEIK
jgi:Carbohydrate-binding module 48 (Isoamylase N-terminal domain)